MVLRTGCWCVGGGGGEGLIRFLPNFLLLSRVSQFEIDFSQIGGREGIMFLVFARIPCMRIQIFAPAPSAPVNIGTLLLVLGVCARENVLSRVHLRVLEHLLFTLFRGTLHL